jgi:zinc transport system substrate-binding protein
MVRLAILLFFLALPAFAEPPRVVADIAPVHALVSQVMEGVATPLLLLDQSDSPHAALMRPSQARMLAEADLVIWVGPELSPWLARSIAGLGTADSLVLMDDPASTLRDLEPPAGMADEEEAHGAEDLHDHGARDPHLWLSVDNARAWLGVFAEDFAARDPENAETYRANASRAQAEIDALAARIDATLAPYAGAEIITFHAALGYFGDRFATTIAGSVRPGDAASPSAAALAALRDLVAEHNIACAFGEPGFDPGLIAAIAGETGLKIGTLDPTGVLQSPGPGHYAATLQAVADNIVACIESD